MLSQFLFLASFEISMQMKSFLFYLLSFLLDLKCERKHLILVRIALLKKINNCYYWPNVRGKESLYTIGCNVSYSIHDENQYGGPFKN
jgi:hypothetical protein